MPRTDLPELLCPAGDEAALRAAIDCGADAVYLGYSAFGARASAVNFDAEGLEKAVCYAHLYHARVHVTVNTLIKPQELEAVHEALNVIAHTGADAVLVQDLGVAEMIRRDFPTLAMHASTQMALCNPAGARFAKAFGFSRVVLARECALDDIAAVAKVGIETETFVHGALCSGVSGRCLMSSVAGGRSGNRGRCAQPCRQVYRLGDRKGALLSLRDLCLLDDLPKLIGAGVRSLKIEGRLKSPEYVATVTRIYRKALDAIAEWGCIPDNPEDKEALLQIFNRGGFTRGHAMGTQDAALCAGKRVGHEGVPLGRVERVKGNLAALSLYRPLNDGDSLQLRSDTNDGSRDADMRYAGPDEDSTAILRLREGVRAFAGQEVVRLSDARQLARARMHQPKPIPITLRAFFREGQPAKLELSDGETTVEVLGGLVGRAQSRPATTADVQKQLAKLGDTPFTLAKNGFSADMTENLFLPVSALNSLRREGCERLRAARVHAFEEKRRIGNKNSVQARLPILSGHHSPITSDALVIEFTAVPGTSLDAQADLLTEAAYPVHPLLIYEPTDYRSDALSAALDCLPRGTWLALPPQGTQITLDAILRLIESRREKLGGILLESVGQLNLPISLPRLLGSGIPLTNRKGLDALMNCAGENPPLAFTLWPEWSRAEQRALSPFPLPALLKVYGRETLMLLNHCPERAARGLTRNREQCALCRTTDSACGQKVAVLIDRKGYRFPLRRVCYPEGCVLSVLNALPTDLRAYDTERRALGAGMMIRLTTEPMDKRIELTRSFAALLNGQEVPPDDEPTTAGHWLRGVE